MLPASEEGTPAVPHGRQDQALDELPPGAPWPFLKWQAINDIYIDIDIDIDMIRDVNT